MWLRKFESDFEFDRIRERVSNYGPCVEIERESTVVKKSRMMKKKNTKGIL